MNKSKPSPEHKDKLGNILQVDDVVAVAHHNVLLIAKVIKLNPKMVKLKGISNKIYSSGTFDKYSDDMVKLQNADVTFYILKNS